MIDTIKFRAGEYIFKKGEQSVFAYIVESGQVEIIDTHRKKSIVLNIVDSGEIFGEMGIIDDKPRSASARAITDIEVTAIDIDRFVDMLMKDPKRVLKFIQVYFEHIRTLTAMLTDGKDTPINSVSQPGVSVTLMPLTAVTATAIGKKSLEIQRFPIRIGREADLNESIMLDQNDLVLPDKKPFKLSRNHASIEYQKSCFVVRDRGSYYGTIVNGEKIGGRRFQSANVLKPGFNELILGKNDSVYRFKIVVE